MKSASHAVILLLLACLLSAAPARGWASQHDRATPNAGPAPAALPGAQTAVAQPAAAAPELLASLGGVIFPYAVVRPELVYLFVENWFRVVDLSHPSHPQIIGQLQLPDNRTVWRPIQVVGNRVYAVDMLGDLLIIDVSNPVAPVLQGSYKSPEAVSYGHWRGEWQVVGTLVYLAVTGKLVILDVSDPGTIVERGSVVVGPVSDLWVQAGLVYIASNSELHPGMRIVDARNPAQPTLVGSYSPADSSYRVWEVLYVGAGLAVISVASCGYLCVVKTELLDVRNPAHPTLSLAYNGSGQLEVAGGYAYLAESDGLSVLDVRDPVHPQPGQRITGNFRAITLNDGFAYATTSSGDVQIFDLQDPAQPRPRGTFARQYATGQRVQVSAGFAYLETSGGVISVFDVRDPDAPQFSGRTPLGRVLDVEVVDDLAYVLGTSLNIYSMRDPSHPILLGSYPGASVKAPAFFSGDMLMANQLVYVQSGSELQILDVRDPSRPTLRGRYALLHNGRMQLAGSLLYIASRKDGEPAKLEIIDVSDPEHPVQRGVYAATGYNSVVTFEVNDSVAYVALEHGELLILDVNDPAHPVLQGRYIVPEQEYGTTSIQQMQPVGSRVYLTTAWGRSSQLLIVDVSSPSNPSLLGSYSSDFELSIDVRGTLVYLVNGATGQFRILDVSSPAEPRVLSTYALSNGAGRVLISAGLAYVNTSTGLHILDVSNPSNPTLRDSYTAFGNVQLATIKGSQLYVKNDTELLVLWYAVPGRGVIPSSGGRFDATPAIAYTVAAGTFNDTVTMSHLQEYLAAKAPSSGQLVSVGAPFQATAVYSATGQPALPSQPYTISVTVSAAETGVARPETLALYAWDGTRWVKEPTSTATRVDPSYVITATPEQFGLFAVLGETHRMYLPLGHF